MKPINIKHVILCADDYGLNAAVSQAIITLLQHQRLSAVSCLTTTAGWPQQAGMLKSFHQQVDIGLHFNLTEGNALSSGYCKKYGRFYSLPALIVRAFFRRLDVAILAQECEAQLKQFIEVMGFLPDFIDGHQHVHQLPQVRTALLHIYQKYWHDKKAYVRLVYQQPKAIGVFNKIKQFIIQLCGSLELEHLLIHAEIPYNSSFAGVYSFSRASSYRQIFLYFLANIKNKGLIMCHPGQLAAHNMDIADVISAARQQEYDYLSSEQFNKDCEISGVRITKFSQI